MQAIALQRPTGMNAFFVMWFGQFVSLIGTGMTRFAVILWAWQLTGQATTATLIALFSMAPGILFGPIAGALVDRWDRKFTMMISDLAAGITTIVLFILFQTGNLQLWHIFIATGFASLFESFQWPAYSAAITTMVDKKHYARTSAMMGLAEASSNIFAPVLAASLYVLLDLQGILLVDIVTFVFAISTLLFVIIPKNTLDPDEPPAEKNLLKDAAFGLRYIRQRPSLLGLQMVFFFGNLSTTFVFVLLAPMVLARTGNNELLSGVVTSALGAGGVLGGILISTWGGLKRRVHGVLAGWILASLLGVTIMGLGHLTIFWLFGGFLTGIFSALINASNQAIWQSKIPPRLQGRVFATRRLIAQVAGPVTLIFAGPLADKVFEPALMPDGVLANSVGLIVGTGPGAGMGFMFVLAGLVGTVVGIVGYLVPAIRNVEDIIPDHDLTIQPIVESDEGEAIQPSVA